MSLRNIKIGRITLAFTFIALGIIIFIEKFSSFKLMTLLFMFWPIIIIALGLEIILSSLCRDKDYKKGKNIDILSISVIIIIITILAAFNLSSKLLNISYKYTDDISEQVIIDENKKLMIDETNIDIEVIKSENKDIVVSLEGVYSHDEDIKSDENLLETTSLEGYTKVTRRIKQNTVYFLGINKDSMKYIVKLPPGIELEIKSSYGDIKVKDISSNINIESNTSDIDFENIIGDISVVNSYGDFKGENLTGNIDIISKSGDVTLDSNFSKNLDIETENADVILNVPKEQVGKFYMVSTYGDIDDELGFSIIESASMDSVNEVRKVANPIFNIRTNKGDITIETN